MTGKIYSLSASQLKFANDLFSQKVLPYLNETTEKCAQVGMECIKEIKEKCELGVPVSDFTQFYLEEMDEGRECLFIFWENKKSIISLVLSKDLISFMEKISSSSADIFPLFGFSLLSITKELAKMKGFFVTLPKDFICFQNDDGETAFSNVSRKISEVALLPVLGEDIKQAAFSCLSGESNYLLSVLSFLSSCFPGETSIQYLHKKYIEQLSFTSQQAMENSFLLNSHMSLLKYSIVFFYNLTFFELSELLSKDVLDGSLAQACQKIKDDVSCVLKKLKESIRLHPVPAVMGEAKEPE